MATEPTLNLKDYIRDIPDFPREGILFRDITTLLKDPIAFRYCVRQLAARYRDSRITKVVAVESRGFLFASALAYELGWGVIPVRKIGKLPAECVKETYELEYGSDCVEMHTDALTTNEQVLVLDDLIATGGTLVAACKLVELLGAKVTEVATVIELEALAGKEKLEARPFFSLLQY